MRLTILLGRAVSAAVLALVMFAGCETEVGLSRLKDPWKTGAYLPAERQTKGDPVRGRYLLLNGDYMTCGIPAKLWDDKLLGNMVKSQLSGALGGAEDAPRIAGREGRNADMPYFLNAFTAPEGAVVINGNCLSCHGGSFDGELVIGLGNVAADFTNLADAGAANLPIDDEMLKTMGLDEAERDNMLRMASRAKPLGIGAMRTVGNNPAEMFAVILAVHHDLETLAWSDKELVPLEVFDHAGRVIDNPIVTSRPAPWWRVKKKNALFYNGMARGDHRGTMALATSVCVEDVERAAEVDAQFIDIQAYVASVSAPVYKRPIDKALAESGKPVFERDCAGCHGTYGKTDDEDTYPNLLIPLEVIGTDPVVAEAGVVHAPQMVEWYNKSFYGKVTRMEPGNPFAGYMPPPLDAVWATAPYLHNASVPTIELVLNSRKRPKYWKRVDYDTTNYDEAALGWPFVALDYGQEDAPDHERKYIYDTTYWSQSNKGHTFGDHLSDGERRAVIEYLKTL